MKKRYLGLNGSARGWLVADLAGEKKRLLVICKDKKNSESLESDLRFFLGNEAVFTFPDWDILPFEPLSPQNFISGERIDVLHKLLTAERYVCIASIDTLSQRLLDPSFLRRSRYLLRKETQLNREDVHRRLLALGYIDVSLVEETGECAMRGAVIDVFPPGLENPVRIHFAGETVEVLKEFDPDSQRTTRDLEELLVLPAKEYFFDQVPFHEMVARVKAHGRELELPPREVARVIRMLRSGASFPGIELMQPFAGGLDASLFSYLPAGTEIVIDDELGIKNSLEGFLELVSDREERFSTEHYLIPKKEDFFLSNAEIMEKIEEHDIHYIEHVHMLDVNEEETDVKTFTTLSNTELATALKTRLGTGSALQPLLEHVNRWRKQKLDVAFTVGSPIRAERLRRYLLDLDLDAQITGQTGLQWMQSPRRWPLVILPGYLTDGFRLPAKKVCFISENEIFAERSYRSKRHAKTSLKKLLSSISNLQENDYVVHIDYGIGIYKGLKQLTIDDIIGDFFQIDYADSKLYLPVQNIARIQKFVAQEGQVPTLDKLGSPQRWVKTKQKVRASVASLAGDLVKLYAARSVTKGWHFDIPGAEDERFADYFAYDETPDQLKAIDETLLDMASNKIMDRLVCGDVGFGKTEVAIRAAYKSIQHARQVAVLVPTTILAEQHFRTFQDRFRDYPVKIAALSRFYDSKTNKLSLEKVESGDIDIIIGTHRLLQRDVQFKDLGLLIIDEEHRFGVAQKERLKQFKKNVDVLTMTATPIPRTLHMSLLGIRDISIISTPPVDRRAIRTYISTYDENLIRDAIVREVHRGGQCFFVHNRIDTIDITTAELAKLVPEARFRFAHGQMSEGQLEPIILSFLQGDFDVLVCTTIIESGIDMPNTNTIIVDRADRYGLAQLYQLRGRVGRSDRQAYAYFLIPESRKLGLEAQKRLKALQSLDDLGLGFNLAIRDLEIRGAGNLLGREQSGSVISVGYELYSRILKEAILNLKGEELSLEESIDPEVKISSSAYIPDAYIPDISERLVLYQRFASLGEPDEAYDLAREIDDRFGPLPEEVENLTDLMRYRALLKRCGVLRAEQSPQGVTLYFSPRAPVDAAKIMQLVKDRPDDFKFTKNLALSVRLEHDAENPLSKLYSVTEVVLARVVQ